MITTIGSLPPGRYPPTGDLARHFLEGRPELFPDLYPHRAGTPGELRAAAEARRQALGAGEDAAPREKLTRILLEQNRLFGAGAETTDAVHRLSRPGTMVVITGQQAGFLGGPLYTFYKALGAIRTARQLSASGVDAVPVFWIAADDHDFKEISPFAFLGASGGIETVRLPGDDREDGRPISARGPGDWLSVAEILRDRYHNAPERLEPFLAAYHDSGNLAEAFGKVMTQLFGRHGLILADPSPREIKALTSPLLERYLGRLPLLEQALVEREDELVNRGYPLQVTPRPGRTGLFLLEDDGRRRALLRRDPNGAEADAFTLGNRQGPTVTAEWLKERARLEPWRFSGSALTRCLFQDFLFPTAVYVGGPGEVAYLAQSSSLYPVLGMTAPTVVHRPSFTIIEPGAERFLAKQNIEPTAAVLRPEELRPNLLREIADPELLKAVEEARHRMGLVLDNLEDTLTRLDPTLSGPVGRVRGGGLKGLDKVSKKVQAALQRREKTTFESLERTLGALRPRGKPQERELSGLDYILRRGTRLLDDLLAVAEPCSGAHQLVVCR